MTLKKPKTQLSRGLVSLSCPTSTASVPNNPRVVLVNRVHHALHLGHALRVRGDFRLRIRQHVLQGRVAPRVCCMMGHYTTDYMLTAKTADLGSLLFDASITVNGDDYKVRSTRKIDDGSLCILSLMKV